MNDRIVHKIEELLITEYHCSISDLKKQGTVYTVNVSAHQPYNKIMTYEN